MSNKDQVLPAEVLSGNLTCDTFFYSKNVPVHKISYRIYYDEEDNNQEDPELRKPLDAIFEKSGEFDEIIKETEEAQEISKPEPAKDEASIAKAPNDKTQTEENESFYEQFEAELV